MQLPLTKTLADLYTGPAHSKSFAMRKPRLRLRCRVVLKCPALAVSSPTDLIISILHNVSVMSLRPIYVSPSKLSRCFGVFVCQYRSKSTHTADPARQTARGISFIVRSLGTFCHRQNSVYIIEMNPLKRNFSQSSTFSRATSHPSDLIFCSDMLTC